MYLSLIELINDFRFKLAIMRVAAVGMANVACTAGLPFGNRPLYAVY